MINDVPSGERDVRVDYGTSIAAGLFVGAVALRLWAMFSDAVWVEQLADLGMTIAALLAVAVLVRTVAGAAERRIVARINERSDEVKDGLDEVKERLDELERTSIVAGYQAAVEAHEANGSVHQIRG